MPQRVWRFRSIDHSMARRLAASLRISPTLARLLVARQLTDDAQARHFLDDGLDHLHDPSLLPDIDRAARRIAGAVRRSEPILIHGDYDVDGVCSAALLARGLKAMKGNVTVRVPHRRRDGYDLKTASIDEAHRNGMSLIITTDCGTQAVEAVERARALGIDVVVTDHHEPGNELADAAAVVNPRRDDSQYPFPAICGAAVAFKVLQATVRELGQNESGLYRAFLEFVAIATISDMMPLSDENRVIVAQGLRSLRETRKPGLRSLLECCLRGREEVNVEDITFQLAPRLNAVGRLGDAQAALELLLCNDLDEARGLTEQMETVNQERRREQDRIYQEAEALLRRTGGADADILILAGDTWHSGLIGPVASRMVEHYRKPAILIASEGGIGRGSARTVGTFPIKTALDSCRDLMERCGGHQQAAGFDLPIANLDAFIERMSRIASESADLRGIDDALEIDATLAPSEIRMSLLADIERMAPFGHGNPIPQFASRVRVLNVRTIGPTGAHLKLTVRGDGLAPTDAIFWRCDEKRFHFTRGQEIALCYRLLIDHYGGVPSLRMEGVDARFPADCDFPPELYN